MVKDVQSWVRHLMIRRMTATLDGVVEGAVFEGQIEKHMAQLQHDKHDIWVTNATAAVLS